MDCAALSAAVSAEDRAFPAEEVPAVEDAFAAESEAAVPAACVLIAGVLAAAAAAFLSREVLMAPTVHAIAATAMTIPTILLKVSFLVVLRLAPFFPPPEEVE